jgi:hypothetical protein
MANGIIAVGFSGKDPGLKKIKSIVGVGEVELLPKGCMIKVEDGGNLKKICEEVEKLNCTVIGKSHL